MEPVERAELLERAEQLMFERKFANLAKLLESDVSALSINDPQLSFLLALAWSHTGKEPAAIKLVRQLLGVLRDRSRDGLLIRTLNLEGALLMESGAFSAAGERFQEALSNASATDDPRFVAAATMNLATLNAMQHRWENAIAELNRAIGVSCSAGLRHQVAGCHHNLGMVFREIGSFAESFQHFGHARRILKVWGTKEEQAATDYESALMVALAGDVQFGLKRAVTALGRIRSFPHRRLEGEALRVVGIIHYLDGDPNTAKICLEKAREIAFDLNLTILRAETAECLQILLISQGLNAEAKALEVEAMSLSQVNGIPLGKGVRWMNSASSPGNQKAS
jgi:tetratricopeptide (TPR) repeat protein